MKEKSWNIGKAWVGTAAIPPGNHSASEVLANCETFHLSIFEEIAIANRQATR
jgi:hypothetical protein